MSQWGDSVMANYVDRNNISHTDRPKIKLCADCEYCKYVNIDDGWFDFYYCAWDEERHDIEPYNVACENFVEIERG